MHDSIREFNFWCQNLGFPQSFFVQVASNSRNMFKVTLLASLVLSASFSSIVDNSLSDNSAKRAMLTFWKKDIFFIAADEAFSKCACSIKYLYQLFTAATVFRARKSNQSAWGRGCICMQLFAGESTNQNREYYKVNDNNSKWLLNVNILPSLIL